MALISTEQLKAIVKTYLDEGDITMDSAEYAALDKVSTVTGLINKIAATFTIEGDYTEEGLADLDGPEITTTSTASTIRGVYQGFMRAARAEPMKPAAMPKAAEMELEACPQVKVSYSLSLGEGNGRMPFSFRLVWKLSRRPVRILWP